MRVTEHGTESSEMWIHDKNGEDVIRVDDDIVACAKRIIAHEAVCIEWGATAERSIELATLEIVSLLESRARRGTT